MADDFRLNRLVLRRLLEMRGCRVIEASDGDEALRAVTGGELDMVFTDLVMPGCDGLDLVRAIRGAGPSSARVAVVVLTASAEEGEREACLAAGADAVLEKPARAEEISEILRRNLGRAARGA